MTLIELLQEIRHKKYTMPLREVWHGIFLRLSLYINGVKPNYRIERDQFYKWPSYRYEEYAVPYTRIFDTEIFSRYPHDSVAQLEFRKSIAAIDDMKSVVDKFFEQSRSIIFQGNNFMVTTEDKALKNWIDTVRIDGFEFYEWVKQVLYHKLFIDPNAWLCIAENHRSLLLPSEVAMPMPHIVGSCDVHYADDNFFATENYAVDKTMQILHKDFNEDTFVMYQHNIGEMPIVQLGGKHVKPLVWHSFIQSFVGIANSYIQEKSDSVIAKKTLAPRLQLVESDCVQCNGTGRDDTKDGAKECGMCKGKGKRVVMNLGDIVAIPEAKAVLDDKLSNLDRFQYKTPDSSYIELLTKDADTEFMRAEKALFVYRKENGGVESGESFDKQFEEKKIFFQGISERIYYLMYEMLKYVSMYLNYNMGNPKPSVFFIDKPINFDLASAEDLITQYSNEKKNRLPVIVTNSSELAYVKKVFGDNSTILKKVAFLQLYDPLYGNESVVFTGYDQIDITTHNYLSQLLELYVVRVGESAFNQQSYAEIYAAILPELEKKTANLPTIF